jgi:hypothetical protein
LQSISTGDEPARPSFMTRSCRDRVGSARDGRNLRAGIRPNTALWHVCHCLDSALQASSRPATKSTTCQQVLLKSSQPQCAATPLQCTIETAARQGHSGPPVAGNQGA